MSGLPRILPLIAVAIGGVVAANALAGLKDGEGLLSPRPAAAEEAAQPAAHKVKPGGASGARHGVAPAAAAKASGEAKPPLSPLASAAPAHVAPAPVCAPAAGEIAKAAGLSPAELSMLQNLQTRRGQIETRERDLDTGVQLLNAAQVKLDGKIKALNTLKAEIQALMGQVDQKTQGEVDRLITVYTKMKPSDAAAVMAQLDDKVRLPIAAAMKPAVLSQILGKMGTLEAKVLTERLAHRFQPIQTALETPTAPAPPPPTDGPQKTAAPAHAKATAHARLRARPARRTESANSAAASHADALAPAAKADVKSVQPVTAAPPAKGPA